MTAQSILLAIGYNMKKLHHKIQSGRIGQHLFPLKKSRWFWLVKNRFQKKPFFVKGLLKFAFFKNSGNGEDISAQKWQKDAAASMIFFNHWCDSPLTAVLDNFFYNLFWSPHSHMLSKIGIKDCPLFVRLYSTLGVIWGYSSLWTSWSASSSFKVELRVL